MSAPPYPAIEEILRQVSRSASSRRKIWHIVRCLVQMRDIAYWYYTVYLYRVTAVNYTR